jgi:cell division septation protein DedD
LAQDDYYYEIQLTNKQLVFYFMAGATGLILSFLAGVMVGRGVEAPTAEAQAATRPVREEKIVTEEPARQAAAPPSAEPLNYAQRLESEKGDESLERPKPAGEAKTKEGTGKDAAAKEAAKPGKKPSKAPGKEPAKATPAPATVAEAVAGAKPTPPSTAKPAPATEPAAPPATAATVKPTPPTAVPPAAARSVEAKSGSFTIQVGAFRDRSTADSVASRLKTKGFAAYVMTPEGDGGLFNVRVGSYVAKTDAERVRNRLKDEEKFNPFIVKN